MLRIKGGYMAVTKTKNFLSLSVLALSLLLVNTVFADRYIVTLKDADTFNKIKALPTSQSQQAFGFSSVTTQIDKSLDNLKMFIVSSDEDLSYLENNPHVLAVEKEVLFPVPSQVSTQSLSIQSNQDLLADQVDTPWGIGAVKADTAWETTQGENATVLVIDTGVDRDHPALLNRFVDGRNFYGRNDDVPYDYFDSNGHGTHVAGTVLADGLNGGLVGVAPQAKLYAARVCGSFGCSPIAIAQAVNWGVDLKVSVMNLSLGGARISRTERLAFERAEEMGVSVVAASGNGGNDRISCPSCVDTVISVGAIDETLKRAEFSQYGDGLFVVAPGVNVLSSVPMGTGREAETQIDLGNGLEVVKSISFQGSSALDDVVQGEMVYVGLGKKEDYEGIDLTGKVALIKRGEITFKDKVEGAMAVGATAAIIFNNAEGLPGGAITQDGSEIGVPVAMIELTLGEQILSNIENKTNVPVASIIINKTNYGSLQGTSMASPHVAGVVALIRSANTDLSPAQVRDIIQETSVEVGSTREYGNGLIDANAAVLKAVTMLGELTLAGN